MFTTTRNLLFICVMFTLTPVDILADTIAKFSIHVDTTALTGTDGYVDFQFNPGNTPYDAAFATIFGFTSDGVLTGAAPDIGDVSGAFPADVVIQNSTQINDHAEGITYGTYLDFLVNLVVPDISGTAAGGTRFSLSILDSTFLPTLDDGADPTVTLDLDPLTAAPTISTTASATATFIQDSTVPEPNTAAMGAILLLIAALAGVKSRRPSVAQSHHTSPTKQTT